MRHRSNTAASSSSIPPHRPARARRGSGRARGVDRRPPRRIVPIHGWSRRRPGERQGWTLRYTHFENTRTGLRCVSSLGNHKARVSRDTIPLRLFLCEIASKYMVRSKARSIFRAYIYYLKYYESRANTCDGFSSRIGSFSLRPPAET